MHRSCTRFYVFALSLFFTLCFTMTAAAKERSHRNIASESNAHRTDRASASEFTVSDDAEPFETDDEIEPLELYKTDDGTFGFSIHKTGNSGTLKDSAIFRLYSTLETANDDEDPFVFSVNIDENTYYSCIADNCPAGDMTDKDIYAGKAYIKGLEPGVYYLAEVAAPKGYQKLPYVFRIIIEEDGRVTWREEVTGALETVAPDGLITIENRAIQLMPGTGGPGRAIFYIIGATCILAAVFAGIHFHIFGVFFISLLGIGALLYPSLSSHWNAVQQDRLKAYYNETAASRCEKEVFTLREAAASYNDMLKDTGTYEALLHPEKIPGYEETLDVTGTGIMGTITIEKIGVDLPIYHGTDARTLTAGAGHLEGTSLPTGGKGNHCVISAHSGFPASRLFDDLDKLAPGDVFVLHVLGEDLYYEVDRIVTVLPTATEDLYLCEGEDYCTLMTCTPYGINTHRLLVRGHRVYKDADGDEDEQTYV